MLPVGQQQSTSSAVRMCMSCFQWLEIRSFLDGTNHDADFYCQEGGEEDKEEQERGHDCRGAQLTDTYPCRQHILDGPWLTTELSHQPSCFTDNIGNGDAQNSGPMQSSPPSSILPSFGGIRGGLDEEKYE